MKKQSETNVPLEDDLKRIIRIPLYKQGNLYLPLKLAKEKIEDKKDEKEFYNISSTKEQKEEIKTEVNKKGWCNIL